MNKNTKASEILKQSLNIYQKRFWTFFLIALIPLLLNRLIRYSTGFLPDNLKIIGRLLTPLITSIIALWGSLSLNQTIQNKNSNLVKIFIQSTKKLFPFLILNLLSNLVILAGLFLFIVPGIIFMIWFSLAFWIFIDQDIRGNNALILSKKYMKGNIGYSFKKMTLIILLSIVPLLIILIFYKENFILSWSIASILSVLINPLTAIYSYFIYKIIKDSQTAELKKKV